jgi:hypothetical protein
LRTPVLPRAFQASGARIARRLRPPVIVFAALASAALLAVPAGAAAAAPATPRAGAQASRPAAVADPETLAADQARSTGKPVVVPTLTTPTSVTSALPDGQFEMTTTTQPVRTWSHGTWHTLDATLARSSDGTWSPKVSTEAVSISGGGTGALATMTNTGRTLSLFWPGSLPQPVVSGDTAVYPSVLPGVDLRVTVSAEGGVRDVLVIHDHAAAANPALRDLNLTAVTTGGLHVTASPAGTLQAATATGVPAFTAPAALAWDSATTATSPISSSAPATSTSAPATSTSAPATSTNAPATSVKGASPGSAAPALSSPDQPGRHAHAAWVKTSLTAPRGSGGVTRQTLALMPDATLLTSSTTVFPAYVDPTWLNSGGSRGWYASTNSLYPANNEYDNTADPQGYLQVGCNGQFCAHTLVQMLLNSGQLKGATINSAVLQFTQVNGGSCANYPVELWAVGSIPTVSGKPFASWQDEPGWLGWSGTGALSDGGITSIATQYAWPSGNCGTSGTLKFDITAFMQNKGPAGPSAMDFGLKATDTNVGDAGSWRELSNAGGAISMTTFYDHKPSANGNSAISPGGACQSASAAKTLVGNDDFTLTTTPSDPDGGNLTVTFVVTNAGSATALVSKAESATSGKPIPFSIPRSQIQGWHSDGASAAYAYSWYTYTTDPTGLDNTSLTGLGTKSQPCLFTYDPTAPQAPGLAPPATIDSQGDIGTIGGTAAFTFGNCTTAVDGSGTACSGNAPSSYVYQVDAGPSQTVAVNGTSQQVTIPLTRYGTNTITVAAVSAAGNVSSPTPAQFDVAKPATAYADGDYAGTGHPDLITVGDGTGSSKNPGLWMAQSNGAGSLSTPVDIGAQGTGVSTNGSPADWAGAQVLHGNFSGNNVQDIVAYYPGYTSNQTGYLFMIGGPGTAGPLSPESGNTAYVLGTGPVTDPGTINAQPANPADVGMINPLDDTNLDTTGTDTPVDLVAAGNASLTSNPLPDLIGILGDGTDGYELNIYTAGPGSFSVAYAAATIAATTTAEGSGPNGASTGPDGQPWGPNWTLQVAQPNGQAVLFALDRATGQLWKSQNQPANTTTTACPLASDFLVGMPCSIWTQVTGGPWTANSGPAFVQADVNTAGSIELWTTSGSAATAWTLSATTSALTQEVANTLRNPGHEWPLTDGPAEATAGSSTLADTQNDSGGATSSGVTFTGSGTTDTDPVLGPTAQFANSASSSLTLPAGILQDTTSAHAALQSSMTLTMKFNALPGATGILAGTSTGSLTNATLSNKSAPILYIGTDGHLYAQFPSGHVDTSNGVVDQDITPMESAGRVDDGLWHTVYLVVDSSHRDQLLYLDDNIPMHLWDNGLVDSATPATIINPGQTSTSDSYGADQVTIGAGIFSTAGWVNADATHGAVGTTRVSYFTGQVSGVAIYPTAFTPAQLPADYPGPVTTVINSGVQSSQCIDNTGGTIADGNPIQIYTCNAHASQNWKITVASNGAMTLEYAANPSYCLNVTSNGTANSTPIDLYGCNGTNGQYWQLMPNGSLMNQGSGKCLADPGASTTIGTQLVLWSCDGTAAQTWASLARPAETAPVGTIVHVQSGQCVNNAHGTTTSTGTLANGNIIQVSACSGFLSEQWTFQPNGTITIAGWCLDNTNSGTADGNLIQLHACNGGGAQEWAHPDTGAIWNPQTGKCIQGSTTAGFQLQLWTCDQDADQTWSYSSTYNR